MYKRQHYYYRVQAYSVINGITYPGPMSSSFGYTRTIPAPESTTIVPVSSTANRLNWNEAPGASGYEILRSAQRDSGYSVIGSCASNVRTFTDAQAPFGRVSYYKVRSYGYVNGVRYTGGESAVVANFPLSTPTLQRANYISESSVRLEWKGVANATGYRIYRATSLNGAYTLLAETPREWHVEDVYKRQVLRVYLKVPMDEVIFFYKCPYDGGCLIGRTIVTDNDFIRLTPLGEQRFQLRFDKTFAVIGGHDNRNAHDFTSVICNKRATRMGMERYETEYVEKAGMDKA